MNVEIEIQDLKQMIADLLRSQVETDRKFQETDRKFQETDRRFRETERLLNEKFQETDKRIKEAFNLFEGQWGKLMESLVEGDLVRILRERGIDISDTFTRRKGNRNGKSFEFDIIAHDTTEIVIVEVKTTLRAKHVQAFLNKMDQIKELLPEYKDYQIMGGVAFLRAEESSDAMAEKRGLFVIRATGDSAALVNKPDFVPKVY
jgi:Holliday junction resolvase-like predicted endonuclease